MRDGALCTLRGAALCIVGCKLVASWQRGSGCCQRPGHGHFPWRRPPIHLAKRHPSTRHPPTHRRPLLYSRCLLQVTVKEFKDKFLRKPYIINLMEELTLKGITQVGRQG